MIVQKRDGSFEPIDCRKITERLSKLAGQHFVFPRSPWAPVEEDSIELPPLHRVDSVHLAAEVARRVYQRVSTAKLDELSVDLACNRTDPHYQLLAGRLAVSCMHKTTTADPLVVWRRLQTESVVHGRPAPPLLPAFVDNAEWLAQHHPELFSSGGMMDHNRDYLIEHFGLTTLQQAYLLRLRTKASPEGTVVERPQHLWMRVAIALHGRDVAKVRETYDLLSLKMGIHATPTLFNSGTVNRNTASCFLLAVADDSLDGIYDTVKQCALVSKGSGGIGLSASNVRARGSGIVSTGGTSNGLVPMLRVFESTVKYVDQGGGKRPGSAAVYLEPWHPDILSFVQLKRAVGEDQTRVRGLFYAVWMCDLFMRRLAACEEWSLFCPDECPGLNTTYGDDFEVLYERYEREGRARARIAPSVIWEAILISQQETGGPFVLHKDAVNRACNQSNLGTIRSSNLCCEITEFTGPNEVAVCNLASMGLPSVVRRGAPVITLDPATGMIDRRGASVDYALLERLAYTMVVNLNRILDQGQAPLPEAQRSNQQHRPLGLGVQGLADVFCLLGLDFDSPEARAVNRDLFETIYFGALSASADLAERDGAYATFWGSPASRGELQFDLAKRPRLAGEKASAPLASTSVWVPSDARHDWTGLKRRIVKTGLRNSLLIALMPTATTSQILGYNECFEPYTYNLYTRRTLSGVFTVVNRHMVEDLVAMKQWKHATFLALLASGGSVAGPAFAHLPPAFVRRYRTATELSMKSVIDLAADRQAFVCQSQSMNLWMARPTVPKLTAMHMYAWQRGLKTGMYYLHNESKLQAQQFMVAPTQADKGDDTDNNEQEEEESIAAAFRSSSLVMSTSSSNNNTTTTQQQQCSVIEDGVCESCSA